MNEESFYAFVVRLPSLLEEIGVRITDKIPIERYVRKWAKDITDYEIHFDKIPETISAWEMWYEYRITGDIEEIFFNISGNAQLYINELYKQRAKEAKEQEGNYESENIQ